MADAWVRQAADYVDAGFSVIPVREKVALEGWKKYQHEIMAAAEIRRSFGLPEVNGIAVVLGSVSGNLACRDFDVAASYELWKAKYPGLADRLPTVRTPRAGGGWHVYFRRRGIKTHSLGDGELRGKGAYTVLPTSFFEGKTYQWLRNPVSAADFPYVNPSEVGLNIAWCSDNPAKNKLNSGELRKPRNLKW